MGESHPVLPPVSGGAEYDRGEQNPNGGTPGGAKIFKIQGAPPGNGGGSTRGVSGEHMIMDSYHRYHGNKVFRSKIIQKLCSKYKVYTLYFQGFENNQIVFFFELKKN